MENNKCLYKKIALAGHEQTPTDEEVDEFRKTVKSYLQKTPNGVVGIHCTHGFNRTGFLIIAYLCLEEDWALEAAVREFASCRPNGIYKQDYLDDLKERYGDDEEIVLEVKLSLSGKMPQTGNLSRKHPDNAFREETVAKITFSFKKRLILDPRKTGLGERSSDNDTGFGCAYN